MRFCKDIGMFVSDRGRISCVYRTRFCQMNCYNNKLYKLYPNMKGADTRLEQEWDELTADSFRASIKNKRRKVKRFRFQSRGETFACLDDVIKVRDIVAGNPDVLFWIPTKAWRDPLLKQAIETMVMSLGNARVQASIDPSNTLAELGLARQWPTMFFGDNESHPLGNAMKCPKTWTKKKGLCTTCNKGCFNTGKVNVWLKQH